MPELTAEEYDALKADIQERGVMVPIEFDEDGNCLDGHHRLRICQELGIKDYPTVIRAGMDEEQKVEHALLENLARRNLNTDQKREIIQWIFENHDMPNARIAEVVCVSLPVVIEERKKWNEKWAHLKNLNVPTAQGVDGKPYPIFPEKQRDSILDELIEHPEKSNRQIAREVGASHHTVAAQRKKMATPIKPVSVYNPSNRDREALRDPDIQRRMAETGSNVAGAIREQKRDQLVEHLESVETREAKAVAGVYDVVVIDPPWPMQKIETDRRPLEIHMDYPVMSIDEIKALDIPTADNCHVFLWTTQKFLPVAFDILKGWKFKYVCTFVWHKVGGYKPLDLPRYDCEFCLYAHKGAPRFVDDHQFWTCFDGQYLDMSTSGHSVKPDEFYDMVRRVTAGRRLDMFNRRHIDGFDGWGKEA